MTVKKTLFIVLLSFFLAFPSLSNAKYIYQGSTSQPLAAIDPIVPGQVFKVWRPETIEKGRWSVGTSADFLRNTDDSNDVDVILSVTGAYGLSDRLTVGGTLPYIIRDPDFNDSDLLDLKAFARYRFTRKRSGPGVGAELLASLPTAAQGSSFPLTLDTTLLKLSLAASGTLSNWDYGLNLGYQSYLESDSGDDSDLSYGFYAGKEIARHLTGILEYSASSHTHTEGSLEEKITEATALVGVKYQASDNLTLGLGIGSGISDSFADLRSQATLVWLPGQKKASSVETTTGETAPEKVIIPEPPRVLGGDLIVSVKPGRGDVLVQVSNRSGVKRLGQKVARYLEKAGYIIPVVEEGTGETWDDSFIYYTRKKADQATEISGMIASPDTITPARYKLKSVGILLVIGKDLAGWRP
jgi:hypothetical protein